MNPSSPTIRRRLQGVVTSTAMKNTVAVKIDRQIAHPKYGKYYTVSRKFLIDDPKGAAHLGDLVEFEECKPMSRLKCWRYVRTVKAALNSSVAPLEAGTPEIA